MEGIVRVAADAQPAPRRRGQRTPVAAGLTNELWRQAVDNRRTLLLSLEDCARCIDVKAVLPVVRQVLHAHAEGKVIMPAKVNLDLEPAGHHYWSNAMPAYVEPFGAVGVKWVSGLLDNPAKHQLPFIMGTILLQDIETGLLLSVMEGSHITTLRTGAAAAVAAQLLAREGAESVALIGAGVQGRTTLQAIGHLMPVRRMLVADSNPAAAARCAASLRDELSLPVESVASARQAAERADIVITATPARHVVLNSWLQPGVTALALGSFQEFDDEFLLSADRIVVDSVEQASHRGTLAPLFERGQLSEEDIAATLPEVCAGRRAGRTAASQRLLCVLVGLGSLDLSIAALVYQRARQLGLGQEFAFV